MRTTINQYVLKVHSRCNLGCDHCYVYEHRDQSWRVKQKVIDLAVVSAAAARIAEHCRERSLTDVAVVLHGGEPLLVGHGHMRAILAELRDVLESVTKLNLQIQTNGIRLDRGFCEIFAEFGVGVGVSLDGDRVANDRHRVYRNGHSSHERTLRALALLREPRNARLYTGILCTIDVRNDPVAVYEALRAERPPSIDLLLPHATWQDPPFRPDGETTPYADWLGRFHERWLADGIDRPPVRLFDSLAAKARGGPSATEALGGGPVGFVTIETDGSWEQADSLKTAFDGAPATGMNVFTHRVSDVVSHPAITARLAGDAALSPQCRACSVVSLCGGGMYAHRYRQDTGFDNPSVYCSDLKELIVRLAPHSTSRPRRRARRRFAPVRALLGDGGEDWRTFLAAYRDNTRRSIASLARMFSLEPLGRLAADGWDCLLSLENEHPDATRRALDHPYIRSWAEHCRSMAPGEGLDLDLAHVAGIAVAAAVHAGVETELLLPVRHGRVHVPGHGSFTVDRPGLVSVRDRPGLVSVRTSAAGPDLVEGRGEWRPLAPLPTTSPVVLLDDDDPFRTADGRSSPLPARVREVWASRLSRGFSELNRLLPDHVAAMSAGGLRVISPQITPSSGTFGAIAITPSRSGADFAEMLVERFQRQRIDALSDLVDLVAPEVAPEDEERLTVTWREDPCTVGSALASTYCFAALATLWKARLQERADSHTLARYGHFRRLTEDGLNVLSHATSLTGPGRELLSRMDQDRGRIPDVQFEA